MKRLLMTSFLCLTLCASMGTTSCSDEENPREQSTSNVTGGSGGKVGGGPAAGGKAASGGTAQSGNAGRAGAGNGGMAGHAAIAGSVDSNIAGGKPSGAAGTSGNAGHFATSDSGGEAGGPSATGGATSSGGQSASPSGGGALAAGGAAPNAGSLGTVNGGAAGGGAISGAPSATGQAGIAGAPGSAGSAGASSCHLAPQSGCPEQACDLDYTRLSEGATACRAIVVAGTEANTCTTSTECAAGYLCVGGSCERFCEDDSHCVSPGGRCVTQLLYGSASLPIPGATACSQNCQPSTAEGCPSSWGCGVYLDTSTQSSYTACHASALSTGTQGANCSSDADCAVGYGCVTVTTNGTTTSQSCLAYCIPGSATPQCPSNTTCYQFNPAVTIGTTQYGICMT